MAPVRIGAGSISNNGSPSFGTKLGVLIYVDALCEKMRIERDDRLRAATVSPAERSEEVVAQERIICRKLVGSFAQSETKSLFDGKRQKRWVR